MSGVVKITTYIKLCRCCSGNVGSATTKLLSEAVSERQQEAHGQDPRAEPFSLLWLLLLLLEKQFFQEGSTYTREKPGLCDLNIHEEEDMWSYVLTKKR